MKQYRWLLFILLPAAVYFGSLWQRPLFLPDEIRYAEIAREMVVSGDWIVPRCAGVPYTEKPVLGYWLTALSFRLFGFNGFALRFVPALCTLLSALLIFQLGKKLPWKNAFLAAPLIYLSSALVFGVGSYGVLDAPFCFFVLLAVSGFFFASQAGNTKTYWLWSIAAGAGLAGGFLIKGFLALALAGSTVFFYLLWQKEYRKFFTLPWIPLVTSLLLVLPWSLAIHRADPEFWYRFVYIEHFKRALEGTGAFDSRQQPFFYYFLILPAGLFPWVLFIPALCRCGFERWKTRLREPLMKIALTASVVWFILFSCSGAKLGTYILPLFPFLALLFAAGFCDRPAREDDLWFDRTLKGIFWLFISMAAAAGVYLVLCNTKYLKSAWKFFQPGDHGYLIVVVFAVCAWWCLAAWKERISVQRKFLYFCAGIGFLCFAAPGQLPRAVIFQHSPESFFRQAVLPHLNFQTLILAERPMATAGSWYLRRTDIGSYFRAGELTYGMERSGRKTHSPADVAELSQSGRPLCILCASPKAVNQLPFPKVTLRSGKYFAVFYNTNFPEMFFRR